MKDKAKKRSRQEKLLGRLYEPVADAADLAALQEQVARRSAQIRILLQIMAASAGLLVIINLATTAFDPLLTATERSWSAIAVLSLGLVAAVLAAHQLCLRPRALEAQRRLIAQRDLHAHALAVHDVERTLGERLESLSPRRPELEETLAAGKKASGRLLGSADGQCPVATDLATRGAELDAYRVALGSLEIDALLQPGFFQSATSAEALKDAVGQLGGGEQGSSPC